MRFARTLASVIVAIVLLATGPALAQSRSWVQEWPRTDFSKHSVDFDEIRSGGPPKDGIPAIDRPVFVPVAKAQNLSPREPVIGIEIKGDARAYPLRVLTWHEIVNDEAGGVPIAATYCPLCNAAIVFNRRVGNRILDFGTTGKLRKSDLVMYDRQTESWWQQFTGEAIVGELTGMVLDILPARLESWENFRDRHPDGQVLVPENPALRAYGANPYAGYDTRQMPFLFDGSVPEGIPPLARVVAIGEQAWSLDLLRSKRTIDAGDFILAWEPGQASALDTRAIENGRDVGNVTVRTASGEGKDVAHHVTFAFVFHAFHPDGKITR